MIREAGIEKFETTRQKLLDEVKARAKAAGLPDPQNLSTEDLENLSGYIAQLEDVKSEFVKVE